MMRSAGWLVRTSGRLSHDVIQSLLRESCKFLRSLAASEYISEFCGTMVQTQTSILKGPTAYFCFRRLQVNFVGNRLCFSGQNVTPSNALRSFASVRPELVILTIAVVSQLSHRRFKCMCPSIQ